MNSREKLARPKINPNEINNHKCVECGCEVFLSAYELKPVSSLISESGLEEVLRTNIFVCLECRRKVTKKDLFPNKMTTSETERT